MGIHTLISVLLLINGYWISFLINVPLLAFNIRKIVTNTQFLDATEIFRTVSKRKLESFIKLGLYFLYFFVYLYCMIQGMI